jgi:hypothetical protein
VAVRRRIGQLAELFLKNNLQRQNSYDQEQQILQRQEQLSRQNGEQQLLGQLLKDPRMLEQFLKSGKSSLAGMDLSPMRATRDQAIQGSSAEIEKADSLQKLPTPQGIINDFQSRPGAVDVAPGPTKVDPRTGLNQPNPSALSDLMLQNAAKQRSLKSAAAPVERKSINQQTGVNQSELVNPYDAIGQPALPTERTAEQEGQRTGGIATAAAPGQAKAEDILRPGKAKTAGAEAGARAAAEFPWQQKLAQVHADTSLLNSQKLDEWKAAHPKATAAELLQRHGATDARTMVADVRSMADEMEKRGMMGPLMGRGAQLASGTIKAEDLF